MFLFHLKNVFSSNAGKISIHNPILYYACSSAREQDDGANKRFLLCLMLCFRLIWGYMEIFLYCITLGLKIMNFPCQCRNIALIFVECEEVLENVI